MLTSLRAVEGATVVDLFAGTGALGIEALYGRVARDVRRPGCGRHRHHPRQPVHGRAGRGPIDVVRADALSWLERMGDRAFDLALCDPPYDFVAWERLLSGLSADLAVLESSVPLEPPPGWMVRTTKRYGVPSSACLSQCEAVHNLRPEQRFFAPTHTG